MQHGLFVAEGPKVCGDLIKGGIRVHSLFALEEWSECQSEINNSISGITISQQELERISGLVTPNQVLAVFHIPPAVFDHSLPAENLVITLDRIRDPGNLGTMVRIADWFGYGHLLCSVGSADVWNPKTVQAAMGSLARVRVYYEDLADILDAHKDKPVTGACLGGDNLYSNELPSKGFLVIGNESAGISDDLLLRLTQKITIPPGNPDANHAESLNASVALAVICSRIQAGEYSRQTMGR